LKLDFQKQGVHLKDQDQWEELQGLHQEVQIRLESLQAIDDYNQVPKAARLQTVSDMYNIIGLSHLQAQKLGYHNVSSIIMEAQNHLASVSKVLDMCVQVADILTSLAVCRCFLGCRNGSLFGNLRKGPDRRGQEGLVHARRPWQSWTLLLEPTSQCTECALIKRRFTFEG
jgi:hypothetical protein